MASKEVSEKEARVKKFQEYVTALNQQFFQWATKQWEKSPTRFWSTGMQDYLRGVAKVRREFSDVLADDDNNIKRVSQGESQAAGPGGEKHAPKYEPSLSMIPYCNTKVIHFIRHGEGFHNIGYGQNPDARLTERGWEQAHALGRHMFSQAPTSGVQLVVVSPMARTLETAAGIFGLDPSQCSFDPPSVLMVAQDGEKRIRIAHPFVSLRPGVKLIAQEMCRERLGPSPCDKRQSLEEAARQFPGVDCSLIESNLDASWQEGKQENESSVVVRGFNFLAWLMQRPETNIAVVTHSAFLWFTLACFGNEFAKPVRENLQRWYENCEMRTVVLSDGGGMGVPDKTWFRGGEAFAEPQKALIANAKEKGKGSMFSAMQNAWLGGTKGQGSVKNPKT